MIKKITYISLPIFFIVIVIMIIFNISDNKLEETEYENKQDFKDEFLMSKTDVNLPVIILEEDDKFKYSQFIKIRTLIENTSKNMEESIYG